MNILFLGLDINIKAKTGDAVHVRELVGSLAKLGHKIDLIAAQTDDSPEELGTLKKEGNVRIFFIKTGRYFKSISTISFCKKVAKKGGAEIIYERRFSAKIGYSLGKMLRIPYIVEINGLPELELKMLGKMGGKKPLAGSIKKRIRRRFFEQAHKIVAVTQGIKDALVEEYQLPPEKIVIVPNGANIDLFRKMDKMRCKQELGLDSGDKYVCFSGNLAPWQSLDTLIKAAPAVLRKSPKTRFLIVGDGVSRKELEDLVNELNLGDSVFFTGFVNHDTVPKYLNSCEICVVTSSSQINISGRSPLKIYEYMACEKPVVASSIKGLDFLKETNSGLLVPPEDPHELGKTIIKLLMNEELAKEMGTNGRQYVVENHSWLGVAQRISGICQQTK